MLAIDHPDIQLQFTSPDSATGTWAGGTVTFDRIGGDDGSPYRFVGKVQSADNDAIVSLNFDGTDFSGEAFETQDGTTFTVTGTLTGDQVMLTATGGGETITATGTHTPAAGGDPGVIVGTTDAGAQFGLAACRLNN